MDNTSISGSAGGGNEKGSCYDMMNGTPSSGHKRSLSGSLLSKLSFLRATTESNQIQVRGSLSNDKSVGEESSSLKKSNRALVIAVQQQKTRRRKGSLRKTALLGN